MYVVFIIYYYYTVWQNVCNFVFCNSCVQSASRPRVAFRLPSLVYNKTVKKDIVSERGLNHCSAAIKIYNTYTKIKHVCSRSYAFPQECLPGRQAGGPQLQAVADPPGLHHPTIDPFSTTHAFHTKSTSLKGFILRPEYYFIYFIPMQDVTQVTHAFQVLQIYSRF